MSIWLYIGLAFSSLRRNVLRTALTILGIVIGVCAVVGVISVGVLEIWCWAKSNRAVV